MDQFNYFEVSARKNLGFYDYCKSFLVIFSFTFIGQDEKSSLRQILMSVIKITIGKQANIYNK